MLPQEETNEDQREGLDVRVDCSVLRAEKRNGASRLVHPCRHPNSCVFQIHGIHRRVQNAQKRGEYVEAELGHQNASKMFQRRRQATDLGLQVWKLKCSSWKRNFLLQRHYSCPSSTCLHGLSNVQKFSEHVPYHSSLRRNYTQQFDSGTVLHPGPSVLQPDFWASSAAGLHAFLADQCHGRYDSPVICRG